MTELKTESMAAEPRTIQTPSICRAVVYTDQYGNQNAAVVLEHKGLGVCNLNNQTLLYVAADVPYNEQPLPHTWRYPPKESGLLVVDGGVVVGVPASGSLLFAAQPVLAAMVAAGEPAPAYGYEREIGCGLPGDPTAAPTKPPAEAEEEEDPELAERDERAEGLIALLQTGYRDSWNFTIVHDNALQLDGTVVRSCRVEIVPPGRAPLLLLVLPDVGYQLLSPGDAPGLVQTVFLSNDTSVVDLCTTYCPPAA